MISSAGPQLHPFLFASFHSGKLGRMTEVVQHRKTQQQSHEYEAGWEQQLSFR